MATVVVGHEKKVFGFGDDELSVTPLGAGCEVGRSCILVEYKNRVVMLDCGIHPAHSGIGALPIFDAVDVAKVDLCLVTHFHLDHCGALPYFVAKTPFEGRVVMTEPTRAVSKLLWMDFAAMAKLSNAASAREFSTASEYSGGGIGASGSSVVLFDQSDIERTLSVVETIDFRQTIDFKDLGISVTAYAAGHVLGACMFCVDIAGVRILYTGDYSREVDRHVPVADIPTQSVHVLICEATYGIRIHEPRPQREKRFLDSVTKIVKRRGKCLLPVFALGRAQELLLMLEEHWQAHPELQKVPIWYASPMSSRSMIVFETFISACGNHAQRIADSGRNPFELKFVKTARRLDEMTSAISGEGPCVVMAAPGMLQSGTSRTLFEMWCRDKRNGVILTGYSLKGTLADELKKNPHSLQLSSDGPSTQIASSFEMISFSAHSDFDQTFQFIQALQPPTVVLVHGERGEVMRLSDKLKELRPSLAVFSPEILQRVTLSFPSKCIVRCLGQIAGNVESAKPYQCIDAIMIAPSDATVDQFPLLVSAQDAAEAADIPCNSLSQSLTCEYQYTTLQPLHRRVREIFERVSVMSFGLQVEGRVDVRLLGTSGQRLLRLDWESDPLADLIADTISFAAVELASPAAALLDVANEGDGLEDVEAAEKKEAEILGVLLATLRGTFESVEVEKVPSELDSNVCDVVISIMVPDVASNSMERVVVNFTQRQVAGSEAMQERIRLLLKKLEAPLLPLLPLELRFS